MNKKSMAGKLLLSAACLLGAPVLHAQTICTFDVGGTSGDFFNYLKDYQLAAKNWGVKDISLKIYKSEAEAASDEAEIEEAVMLASPALDQESRDKLSEVLRELLECKRILERARET